MNFPSTPQHWLIISVVFVIIEILPPPTHFFFLCLAFGALAAAVTALWANSVWVQWVVFGVGSLALLPVLIPLARFLFTPKETPTNVDALKGASATVVEPLDGKSPGIVRVRGEEWRALSQGERFEKDQTVEIVSVDGTHVIVKRSL